MYYGRAIETTMLISLKSLVVVQTKPKNKIAKKITQFFNYSASHSEAVPEYIRSGMILHIYSDAYYISEPEARSRAGGYFFLGPKSSNNIPIIEMPNPLHLGCIIMRNFIASFSEA